MGTNIAGLSTSQWPAGGGAGIAARALCKVGIHSSMHLEASDLGGMQNQKGRLAGEESVAEAVEHAPSRDDGPEFSHFSCAVR